MKVIEEILRKVDSSLYNRQKAASILLEEPEQIRAAVELLAIPENDLSIKALYTLEVLGRSHPEALFPYLSDLLRFATLYDDSSARRCFAKIFSFFTNEKHIRHFSFDNHLKDDIVDICFSWLISEGKTAVKVFCMQCIFDLRKHKKWIPLELKALLEKDLPSANAGYKARGRLILRKLKQEFSEKI